MTNICTKCGHNALIVTSSNAFRHAIKPLSNLVKLEIDFECPGCGQKSGVERVLAVDEAQRIGLFQDSKTSHSSQVKRHYASLSGSLPTEHPWASVGIPSVFRVGENVLFPTNEGNVQDGTVIDRYGKPDLLCKFGERYFELYRSIMPIQRVPNSLIEVLPALHLLVVATELGLKAFLIRDGKTEFSHSLQGLYENLENAHRDEIDRRFIELELNANLAGLGVEQPSVTAVLQVYDSTYGGESKVYTDSRYYAEPTTMFRRSSDLHGANLVKSHNPYPIFLPELVRIFFETYHFFSGHERLQRLGADLRLGVREPGIDNHGDWGLVPDSLGLIVLAIPQKAGISAKGKQLTAYKNFLSRYPPEFRADWMYGGNTLLFYAKDESDYEDGSRILDGVQCRVWRQDRLGMHARDLNLLADVLEGRSGGRSP